MTLRSTDFESVASTNSAIPAIQYKIPLLPPLCQFGIVAIDSLLHGGNNDLQVL